MPYFNFKGRNARGELITGTLEGADAGVIADQLMNTGVTPVDISSSQRLIAGTDVPDWWRRLNRRKVSLLDLMLFSRQMYTLLKAGVPILPGTDFTVQFLFPGSSAQEEVAELVKQVGMTPNEAIQAASRRPVSARSK